MRWATELAPVWWAVDSLASGSAVRGHFVLLSYPILLFGPRRSHSSVPARRCDQPARAAAVKDGPLGPPEGLVLVWGFRSQAHFSRHSSFPSFQFLCSTLNPVSSPRPTHVGGCRAQGLSRPAVDLLWPRAPLFPGRALIDPSTAAGWLWSG